MNNYMNKFSSIKLTRKEFLLYIGAIFVGIVGIPTIFKVISEVNPRVGNSKLTKSSVKTKSRSFGSGAYGV